MLAESWESIYFLLVMRALDSMLSLDLIMLKQGFKKR